MTFFHFFKQVNSVDNLRQNLEPVDNDEIVEKDTCGLQVFCKNS